MQFHFESPETYNMNLFILDENPVICASYYTDSHVNKILLEACQMACTAHHAAGTPPHLIPYRKAYLNHPVTAWVRENTYNYWWTVEMIECLISEFYHRYKRGHACQKVHAWLADNEPDIPFSDTISFLGISVEDGSYKIVPVNNNQAAVATYRQYVIDKKKHLAKWTNRKRPYWFPSVTLNSANKEQIQNASDYWERLSFNSQPFLNSYP